MKRILAAFGVAVACLILFSACKTEDKFVYIISGDVDFGNETIYFTSGWPQNFVPELDDDGSGSASDNYTEAFRKHYKKFISTYNVKSIEGITGNYGDSDGSILMTLLAGTNKSMFLDLNQATIYNFYKLNLLWAFNDLTNVNLEDTDIYGTPEYLRSVTFNDGKTYGMKLMGAWNDESVGNGLMFYNANLVRQFGADDPWQLYKDGKWTFSNFSSYLDSVSDMTREEPIYGLEISGSWATLFYSAVFANGGTIYNNDSGSWQYSLLSDGRSVAALSWASSITTKDNVAKEDPNQDKFTLGRATIYHGYESIYFEAIKELTDVYFIPFPTGSSVSAGEENYSTYLGGTRTMCVPADRDPDEAGYFMSLYFSDFEDYPLAIRQRQDYRNKFFSDDSYNYYVNATKKVNSIGAGYPLNISSASITSALVNVGNGASYSSVLSAIATQVQRELDETLNRK